ncbi:hypothetical protein HZU73_03704 [Apis mellifera caucasica]|uniref:Uncharacterized protein LOC412969 n=1 Tax=Apis mellifera TaxID=7460 RepID=A0A7M7GRZ6_APIME|nr:uncharacterized protein LOC412969 [Apis mellifera]KAG6800966.1 hypothetical protein HZU73_03704 [Apis mellifera caucasica]|eukprot:XP_006564801.1 uncharacterized protein LOC412969 [Apis mellifera]
MIFEKLLLIIFLIGIYFSKIQGRGLMLDPISRSSAWRKGFPVEPNYNDHELFCGGLNIQYEQNEGRCGECGDDYAIRRPRPNENGGLYGTGVIVKRYKANQIINVKLKLTENRLGTFTFNLCPLNETFHLETEKCFNQYPLKLNNIYDYNFQVPNLKTEFNIAVRIPNITCNQCVFRWTYKVGNNFGRCYDNGNPTIGCGPQETIRNCADIAIEPDENS